MTIDQYGSDKKNKFQPSQQMFTQQKNEKMILEGVWGTQPSPNRGLGGESPKSCSLSNRQSKN
ncbi:hypothetical protein ACQFX9_05515 [Aliinostoc sp. HNIBRCY26]|uniref:hypothetical protein n=1 Tax=Aliinostoc sp. HNIBRCY26 TaxID=3418997 RepID=UPI003CFE669A